MRLTPYIAALLVLSAAGTAIAGHGGGTEELNPGEPLSHTNEYDDTLYAQQGWWTGSGISGDNPGDTPYKGEWIRISEGRQVGSDAITGKAHITVQAKGPVLAAMDVFKAYPSGQTPTCPQPLVTDVLPGDDFQDDPFAYPFDLADRTQNHQRAATNETTMEITLDVSSQDSFYVAIYPQAVSAAAAGPVTEDPQISWKISYESEATTSDDNPIDLNFQPRRHPSIPYDATKWTGGLLIDTDCLDTDANAALGPEALPELPGTSPVDQRVTSMLNAQLPAN